MSVSVIIPTYNRGHLISRAIKSVLCQSFQDFELIVVDDGSTDDTEKIVKSFNDGRIVYVKQINRGPSLARNTGISHARGKYISFLDSDDEWLPNKLERQIDVFKNSKVKNLGFVGGRIKDVNNKGEVVKESKGFLKGNVLVEVLDWRITHDFIHTSTVLLKKETLEIVGGFDNELKINEDIDLWLRLAQNYNFDMVDEVVTFYYLEENSLSNRSSYKKRIKNKKYFLKKNKDIYEKYPNIYSKQLRNIGTYCVLASEVKEARNYFIKSIKISPLSIRNYFNLVLSFLGQYVYLFVLNKKVKKFDS